MAWYKRYGCPEMLISDQGPHFRNRTVDNLCARLKVDREFSPVYSPWLNVAVERINKNILQIFHALLIEYKLDFHEWPYLLAVVQTNLNHTPVRSLAGHSPMELFTGLQLPSALDVIVRSAGGKDEMLEVSLDAVNQHLDRLRSSLHGLHKEVVDEMERRRLQVMVQKNGVTANFDVGDFVLWSRIDQRLPNNKFLGQWVGPFQVVSALPHSFQIRHLVTGAEYEVHGTRLKYYADDMPNVTEEIVELVAGQGMVMAVQEILEHRINEAQDRWELKISWAGLQPVEDSWESADDMLKDIPTLVKTYVATNGSELLQAHIG